MERDGGGATWESERDTGGADTGEWLGRTKKYDRKLDV